MPEQTIAVAMSGGVDSSVVAGMLRARGENVVGLTMQLWNQRRLPDLVPEGGSTGRCCSLDDVYDARHVAQILGIPYRSEEHTSELQSLTNLVCRLLLEK